MSLGSITFRSFGYGLSVVQRGIYQPQSFVPQISLRASSIYTLKNPSVRSITSSTTNSPPIKSIISPTLQQGHLGLSVNPFLKGFLPSITNFKEDSKGLRKAYGKLSTEFYDISKPVACPQEVAFYADVLKGVQGPSLEGMCGSGRLLLPLLRLGFKIDGFDNSAEMLASCKQRCLSENFKVSLFNQQIESLSLNQYSLILLSIGSFQLISDRVMALKVLSILHSHLQPGGSLVLDMFIPWDRIKESIEGDVLSREKKIVSSTRVVLCSDGAEIFLKSMSTIDPWEQVEVSKNQYEKRLKEKVISHEEEEMTVRWYYPYEMQLLLYKAGFSRVLLKKHAFEHSPNSIIYQAFRS